VAISDIAGVFLPPDKRHWFNLFRFIGSLSLLVLLAALASKGVNSGMLVVTALSVVLLTARLFQSGLQIKKHGPWLTHLRHYPEYAMAYFKHANRSNRMALGYLAIASGMLFFPQLAYWTHYNGGEARLDDILTGFQAQSGIHFALKLLVFETLISNPAKKCLARGLIALLFVLQWPFMLPMFYLAPLPVVHAVVEFFEIYLAVLAFKSRFRTRPLRPEPPPSYKSSVDMKLLHLPGARCSLRGDIHCTEKGIVTPR
tara:strand:+ start:9533 stop:10303 length:771 start_codon:yes stop_codon:yes gene_type:complete